ncbi:hypothetical protein CAMRE0001_1171 [Campylobacter rectus RM3267]|uniref:Uncharacterized protein n=2 Tax=Campylobacter rectus TaxID=203 RepID=A0A6G5QL16_CAMRE|nr:hypothetical protein [Campylobacter rectus]EEF14529.1 hypothetical protein CAMRE0001_1171 [Campylobacter rectus RM3267]QCD46319.1 hypothetical protein CRECT_0631 [Campylobacter rectus]UEB47021.1 hypothetical protein LK437_08395 [Campylobacter rectus]
MKFGLRKFDRDGDAFFCRFAFCLNLTDKEYLSLKRRKFGARVAFKQNLAGE